MSLTRVEARRRAELIGDVRYSVELDLTDGAESFRSRTEIHFRSAETGADTFLDVRAHSITSATLNGTPVGGVAEDGRLALHGLAAENVVVVDAVMAYSRDGEGLHRFTDPADGRTYLYAMSFLDAAPRWFACFDQPDLKAPVSFDVTCPTDWTVAGNGPAVPHSPGRWSIESAGPLATYYTTLVAGPYHQVRDEHDGIPLVLHVRQSLAEHLDRQSGELLDCTKHCLDELHRLFGVRYPWGEYHQAFVPEFNAGAMENPGCVTFRDNLVFRSRATDAERLDRSVTVAHEMAHMWFGDLVTMRWWDDLWLNESFAEYLGHRVVGEHTWPSFDIERKSWGYRADRRPSTHPVAGNGAVDAAAALSEFDGISYAKGASVLRQLAVHLGDARFLAGLRDYVATHAHANAEFGDLVAAWTRAGAEALTDWTDVWLRTTGVDVLTADGPDVVRTGDEGRPHAIGVAVIAADGSVGEQVRIGITGPRTPHGLTAEGVVVPDCADETWAKVAFTEDSWRSVADALPAIADPRTRVTLWNALQLATADAELDPRTAVDVVTSALPAETDDVVGIVGRWAVHTLAGSYLDGAARASALSRIGGAMLAVVDVADPGSGRQLAAARVAARSIGDLDLLTSWLAGRHVPAGLEVDAEFRWLLLARLAAAGRLVEADIAAELTADNSAQGAVHAARCRAALPDPAAKAAAWQALMHDPDRPNYELYALAEGFWQPGQDDLTGPYVDRWFDGIGATAAIRSGFVLDRVTLSSYPWTAVSRATLDATTALIADGSLPAGMRRSIVDAGDDLRRALAVRERFG